MRALASLLLAPLLLPSDALADLPLTVEDLLTAHQRYRVEANMEYQNREDSDLSAAYRESLDSSRLSLGLRYGLSLDTEWFVRATAFTFKQRRQLGDRIESDSQADWGRLLAGVNHRFSADNRTPALLGFVSVNLADNAPSDDASIEYFHGGSVGLTTYRSLDPLLLSAVLRYEYRAERDFGDLTVDPGDSITFSPQAAFAVNHWVTLTGGFQWEWRESARWLDRDASIDRTRTSLLLGLGYTWNEDLTISLNGQFAVTDTEGSSLSLAVVYKFDDG